MKNSLRMTRVVFLLNLAAIVVSGWLLHVDVPDAYAATRFRNSLIAELGQAADFEWSPEERPAIFRQETAEVPQEFARLWIRQEQSAIVPHGLDAAIAIVEHLHDGPGRGEGIQADTITAYRKIRTEKVGYCADFIQVFNGLAHAANLPVREWGMSFNGYSGDGHSFSEIYDVQAAKWILIDVFNSLYFVDADSGEPLSALEIRSRMLRPRGSERVIVRRIGPEPIGFPKEEKLYEYYRSGANEFFLYYGNNVFSYDNNTYVQLMSPVSRSLEQLGAILIGVQPPIYVYPSKGTSAELQQLRDFRNRVLLKIGLLLLLMMLAGATGWHYWALR